MKYKYLFILLSCLLTGALGLIWYLNLNVYDDVLEKDMGVARAIIINEPIQPLALPIGLDARKVALGEQLFHDAKLSADNTISCAHCHDLDTGGVDGLPRSLGINGNEGDVNAPTVFNAGLHIAQFWDGRASSLEDQIDGPTHNPKEMGSNWPQIIDKLKADADYIATFRTLYADGINTDNVKDAIATFEHSLITINAPFDRYLRGDQSAISEDAKAGYKLFKDYGCVSCHQGANVGGNMFQVFGVMRNYFADRGHVTMADLGRFNVTGLEEDRHVFRVPCLRLVTLTAPYFHDGSAATLHDAIHVMGRYQLGREISDTDEQLIIKFLQTLVGEFRGKRLGL